MCKYERGFNKGFMWAMHHSVAEVRRYLTSRRSQPTRGFWKGYMEGVKAVAVRW